MSVWLKNWLPHSACQSARYATHILSPCEVHWKFKNIANHCGRGKALLHPSSWSILTDFHYYNIRLKRCIMWGVLWLVQQRWCRSCPDWLRNVIYMDWLGAAQLVERGTRFYDINNPIRSTRVSEWKMLCWLTQSLSVCPTLYAHIRMNTYAR